MIEPSTIVEPPDLTTREELLSALDIAAELEHSLLCQYLFAACTLKRSTAEGLTKAELEIARRWGAATAFVARQEMQHLGLVMNLRSAIGGMPLFERPKFPHVWSCFGQAELRQELTRLDAVTIARFQQAERPHPAPPPRWCSLSTGAARELRARALAAIAVATAPARFAQAPRIAPPTLTFDSVQQLYLALRKGFATLAVRIGERALFCGDPSQQIYGGAGSPYHGLVNDLIRVIDLDSATAALDRILLQGEGIAAPPDAVRDTHYCIFTGILDEMNARPALDPARPVVRNPRTTMPPGVTAVDQVNVITRPETREVAVVTNGCYELMLSMLLYLYGQPGKTPEQSAALTDALLLPLMTRFLRPLSEMLTQLPAFTDRAGTAGPAFELFTEVLRLPCPAETWPVFQEKLDHLTWALRHLSILDMRGDYPAIAERLDDLGDDMGRLAEVWRTDWKNIGRVG